MKILDVLNAPWAIVPEKLEQVQAVVSARIRGDSADLAEVEAAIGRTLENEHYQYDVIDGVAVLAIDGILAKKMNMMTRISGGASMQMVGQEIERASADESVKAIVLTVDSPGGTVDGAQELARTVRAAADAKPVIALVDGMMASAAYWIGSAADSVYISANTDMVGSIGVVTSHLDVSRYEDRIGIKTTEIYAGTYKRIASEYAPLSAEGEGYLQEQVDYLYSVFIDGVAQNRGVSVEKVLNQMADGRVFIGRQAIDAGLVDGATTLSDLVRELAVGAYRRRRPASAKAEPTPQPRTEREGLTLEERSRQAWDSNASMRAEFADRFDWYLACARAESQGKARV